MTDQPGLTFHVDSAEGRTTLRVDVDALIVAGWTGRDPDAMEEHISELEKLGVTRPATTPIFYRVSAARLTQHRRIEVPGTDSSGEVEFVLLRHAGKLYVGLGSDHTDRKVEAYGITISKQMCDKPVADTLWPYEEARPHWDQLVLRSWIDENGAATLYQEGQVSGMLDPDVLLATYERHEGPLPDGAAMLCGTLPARGGVRHAPRFTCELEDPVLGRKITHDYRIDELPVRG